MKKKRILSLATLLAALVLIIGTFTFIKACPLPTEEGVKPMKCVWTYASIQGLGVLMAFTSIVKLTSINEVARKISLVEAGIGIYGMSLITTLIGTCKVSEMMCNISLRPFGLLILGIYTAIALVGLFLIKE